MSQGVHITVHQRAGRQCASSGSKWEPIIGYSRAVRSGNIIAVTGTVGINTDGTYSKSVEAQTRRSLEIIQAAIESLGGTMSQIIRTRMFVTDISQWQEVAKAHGAVFADIRPATTIVQVAKLIDGEALIEIEADAVVLVVTAVVEKVSSLADLASEYAGYARDVITLTWDDRRQGHGRRRSDAGLEFAISLPSGVVLKAGDCFVLSAEKTIVAVREADERVYVLRPKRPQDWAYYAYHVGNRHQSVMIGETELVFLESPAVKSLLDQLHAEYTADTRPFTAALAGHSH